MSAIVRHFAATQCSKVQVATIGYFGRVLLRKSTEAATAAVAGTERSAFVASRVTPLLLTLNLHRSHPKYTYTYTHKTRERRARLSLPSRSFV